MYLLRNKDAVCFQIPLFKKKDTSFDRRITPQVHHGLYDALICCLKKQWKEFLFMAGALMF